MTRDVALADGAASSSGAIPLHTSAARKDATAAKTPAGPDDVRVIAFYLPQFHPIPENDAWWGEGFTEWTNVARAQPRFVGHDQPRHPGELGCYDLRDPEVRNAQAKLAREHGVHGFCYYHYWFNGRRVLERPLEEVLASGEPDFPFCVCWANENWTRRWDGRDDDVLLAQNYSHDDDRAFIRDLLRFFRDPRYIRVHSRPLLLVFRASALPSPAQTAALWREECRAAGIGEIYLAAVQSVHAENPAAYGFDAAVEFPPLSMPAALAETPVEVTDAEFAGNVHGYRSCVAQYLTRIRPGYPLLRGVMPSWDNTARRQRDPSLFVECNPETFQFWVEEIVRQARRWSAGDERLVFVNAWNEWAEGCYLEPDRRHGRQYLEALRAALAANPSPYARPAWRELQAASAEVLASPDVRIVRREGGSASATGPLVSIVMPAYNHARFVGVALASLAAQTWRNVELVAVDDGSSDATGSLLDEFADSGALAAVTVIHQPNAGAHEAINRGLALARGEFVAILNSDDSYAPSRIERMVAAMDANGAGLAFSDTEFVDDEGRPLPETGYVGSCRKAIDGVRTKPNLLHALINVNVSISTGNFVLRREFLERAGGFCAMRICHDWDYLLAATYLTRVEFVPERLYHYRLHDTNTYASGSLRGTLECDELLCRFFAHLDAHPMLADPQAREAFLRHVAASGKGGYLPAASRPR